MSETARYCEICGEMIGEKRAKFLPDTRLCITHARQIAEMGGEFIIVARNTSLAKEGSLKKNYGDVTAQQRRNHDALRKLKAAHAAQKDG
jgi:hypothetical protein